MSTALSWAHAESDAESDSRAGVEAGAGVWPAVPFSSALGLRCLSEAKAR